MAKKINVVSIDDGYHDYKLTDGEKDILLPGYSTEWVEPSKDDLEFDDKGQIVPLSYIKAETVIESTRGPEEYVRLVGSGALEQDIDGSWNGSPNRHISPDFLVIFRTSLALITPGEGDAVVDLLNMNLPVEYAENEERIERLRKRVVGWHKIRLTLADGTVLEREINVKELVTNSQPFAAYMSVILNDDGEISNRELAIGYNVLVDIGARTQNAYGWEMLKARRNLKMQSQDGIFTAYEAMAARIKTLQGKDTAIASIKIPQILKRGQVSNVSPAELEQIRDRSYEELAVKSVTRIESKMATIENQVDNVIWGCGGGEVLEPFIREFMLDYPMIFLNRFSVARGGWKLAVRTYKERQAAEKAAKQAATPAKQVAAAKSEEVQS
ncbi:hypothetical protein [Paenibacillus xylanexedens]|uniref:ParM/StbA family protein n=1 Tax=Paenibacillus xylanexedens TaxID=528191 RepID=UPI0011A90EE2|nr:hypothetical protein [Paenibacillus xylanexedens]